MLFSDARVYPITAAPARLHTAPACRCIWRTTRATVRARPYTDPYNRENIERVQRDEAEARERERAEEERLADADRNERLWTLRLQRDGRAAGDTPARDTLITTREGHINFWQDCELGQAHREPQAAAVPPKTKISVELNPWYSNAQLRNGREQEKNEDEVLEDCYKDTALKSAHDPLRSIHAYMDQKKGPGAVRLRAPTPPGDRTLADEREAREARERERAAQLRAKRGADPFFRAAARAEREARARRTTHRRARRAHERRALG